MKRVIFGLAISSLLFMSYLTIVMCQELPKEIIVEVWTDKQVYKPGEEGKLFILIMNNYEEGGIFIDNITITYPWWPSYVDGKWVGNDTIIPTTKEEKALEYGDIYQTERTFKIPNDGRAKTGEIEVEVTFADGRSETRSTTLLIVSEYPSSVEGLDKIVTLLTVQIILTVISAFIVAAAVYLSVKKLAKPSSELPTPPPTEHKETE